MLARGDRRQGTSGRARELLARAKGREKTRGEQELVAARLSVLPEQEDGGERKELNQSGGRNLMAEFNIRCGKQRLLCRAVAWSCLM